MTKRLYLSCAIVCVSIVLAALLIISRNTGSGRVENELIHQAAQRGMRYLSSLQQKNGQIIIGHHKIYNVWETMEAARAISLWRPNSNLKNDSAIQSALAFLRTAETSVGMVLHHSEHQGSFCVETSAEYVRLLAFLEKRNAVEPGAAERKARYLKSRQLLSGEWRIESAAIPIHLQTVPSVTGFALGAMAATDMLPRDLKAALQYLRASQKKEGHWGGAWQYYGTPLYVMEPVLSALRHHNVDGAYDDVIEKARGFLFKSQTQDGRFDDGMGKEGNWPSAELQTALGLRSLLGSGVHANHSSIRKGIEWLLTKQSENGSWNGGTFPFPNPRHKKKEDIFCTSQTLLLMHEYTHE